MLLRSALLVMASVGLALAPARAADTLRLAAAQPNISVGAEVTVDLVMEFDTGTLGGAIQLNFDDGILKLNGIRFSGSDAGEPDFRCPTDPLASEPIPCPANPLFLSFGAFDGISAGTRTVATLTLEAVGAGMSDVSASVASPFADSGNLGDPLSVGIEGTTITVPEPGMSVLGVSLLGFALLARLRRQRAQPRR